MTGSLDSVTGTIRGVLFDIDDTLVDTASAFGAALRGAFSGHAELDDALAGRMLATWRADSGGHYRSYIAGRQTHLEQRYNRVAEITDLLGLPRFTQAEFETWDADYLARFEESWTLFEDARAAIEAVSAAGLAVGGLTNAPLALQRRKLQRVGLGEVFEHVVAIDVVGVGKPDPRIFAEGCRVLGTQPHETLYVGDELDVDALGAVRAGLVGVWLDRPGRRRGGPHAVTPEKLEQARADGVHVLISLADLRWRTPAPPAGPRGT